MLTVREQVAVIILGTVFLFVGIAACRLAVVRGRPGRRILAWFGIFSSLYGVRLFAAVPDAFSLLAGPFSGTAPQLVWIITYVILVFALLFWMELSLGTLRRLFYWMLYPAGAIAVAGSLTVLLHKTPTAFMPYSNVMAICLLLVLALAHVVPQLAKKKFLPRETPTQPATAPTQSRAGHYFR